MATTAVHFALIALLVSGAAAYTNHTVGGNAGWFFNDNTNTSSANYSSWASNQTFNLGDYLIFPTNTNQTVILTYNDSTFQTCSVDNSSDTDTFIYSGGNGQFGQQLTVAVPLTVVGENYLFSDADDGIQCEHGMAFGINVSHGAGLPPNLNQPPPPPYVEPPSSVGDGGLTPTLIVPSGAGLSIGANVRHAVYHVLSCGIVLFFLLVVRMEGLRL